jgi:hypothetical protein
MGGVPVSMFRRPAGWAANAPCERTQQRRLRRPHGTPGGEQEPRPGSGAVPGRQPDPRQCPARQRPEERPCH